MDSKPFLKELAFELGLDPSKMTPDLPIDVPNWDSLALFSTIGNIQRYFDIVVDAGQLQRCRTIGEMLAMIETRKGQPG